MDRFELHVGKGGCYQYGILRWLARETCARARTSSHRRARAVAARSGRCRAWCRRSSSAIAGTRRAAFRFRGLAPATVRASRESSDSTEGSRRGAGPSRVPERRHSSTPPRRRRTARRAPLPTRKAEGPTERIGFPSICEESTASRRTYTYRKRCGSGRSVVRLSSRPSARIARSSRRCRSPLSSRGGSGGSGFGLKARTSSPPLGVTSNRPVRPSLHQVCSALL